LAAILGSIGVLAMGFVFYVSWIPQLIHNTTFAALTWPSWALPYVFFAWTAIGVAWYWAVRLRLPEVIAQVGRSEEAPEIIDLREMDLEPAAG
jgi:hypothetical protein